ncbi:decaprenyl-phosphate phosphoribosyltransferase [Anaerolineales bacterium]
MQAAIGLIRTMRPRQWTKNILFVLPGIIFDQQLTNPEALFNVAIACILLILMSGTVYIINDIADVENDREHPKKKFRPIAAGQLPIRLAVVTALIIPTVTLIIAFIFNIYLFGVLVAYLILQIVYTFYLKHVPILDILVIMTGFVLRILAGVVVIDITTFSPWLYVCGGLLALLLTIGKRRQDLVTLGDEAIKTRPIYQHYNLALLDDMLRLVVTSTLITYILYTIEADTRMIANVNLAIITVPVVLYGLFRYLYIIHVTGEGSAPDELLLKDRPLQVTIVVWALMFIILLYILPS